jgi:hypothetical protein
MKQNDVCHKDGDERDILYRDAKKTEPGDPAESPEDAIFGNVVQGKAHGEAEDDDPSKPSPASCQGAPHEEE